MSSTTFKNALKAHRRTHKERSQPGSRSKFGLLEKHKDYVLRAQDHHFKQKRLKALKERALDKNPDEFYHKMISSKTKDGVHKVDLGVKFSADELKLFNSQDLKYMNLTRTSERRKIEKMQSSLHLLEDSGDITEDFSEIPSLKSNHTIFVDSKKKAKTFNAAEHFDTVPELINQKYNRPRVSQLEEGALTNVELSKRALYKLKKRREKAYHELASRINREQDITKMTSCFETQKALMNSKGKRRKVGQGENGVAVYKWKQERSR
eukprot:Nk52_evm7s2010 gene=Nk52_evmTU7s2010